MEELLFCMNQIIELIQTLICINLLFRPRYYFKIYDGIFFVAEVVFLEIGNLYHLNAAVVVVAYLGIYAYALAKFRDGFNRTLVNVVLYFIINSFTQLVCSGLLFIISFIMPLDREIGGFVVINILTLLLLLIASRKKRFYRLSQYVLNSDRLTRIAMVGSLFVIFYLIVVYKAGNYFRATDYLVFGIVTILICVLALSWQKEKCEKTAKENELALWEQYDKMFEDLITSVRRKQHDIDDQINIIYCQHKMAKSLEELVSLQKDYCDWIEDDSSLSHLLAIKNSILGGFLYSKLGQMKEAGCKIEYEIKVGDLTCAIPIYKIVEILSVLLNNAREALENREKKNVFLKIRETDEEINFLVQNSYEYIPRNELVHFLKLGYSTKGENRGLGLANVMDILHQYNGEMEIQSDKNDEDAWISFEVCIKKEGMNPSS